MYFMKSFELSIVARIITFNDLKIIIKINFNFRVIKTHVFNFTGINETLKTKE
jgi:uncharacterized membrane protein